MILLNFGRCSASAHVQPPALGFGLDFMDRILRGDGLLTVTFDWLHSLLSCCPPSEPVELARRFQCLVGPAADRIIKMNETFALRIRARAPLLRFWPGS